MAETKTATTEVAEAKKPTSMSAYIENKLTDIQDALPKDLNKTKFVTNAMALLNTNEQLQKCSQASIVQGLMQSAVLGLDAQNKECYLVPYGNKAEFSISYTGAVKLAKKYAQRPVKDIYAKVVREGDVFEENIIDGKQTFNFKPKTFSNGEIVGVFAVCEYKDGTIELETMSKEEIDVTRSKSKAKNAMAWSDFYSEMARKTVVRRLCKHIELDFDNPTQFDYFTEDGAIETEVAEAHDVFAEDEVIDTEAKEVE